MAAADVAIKVGFIQRQRMRHEQGFVATTAVRRTRQIVAADPVGGVAMGADNVQGISHEEYLSFIDIVSKPKGFKPLAVGLAN